MEMNGKRVTDFGKFCRLIRVKNDLILKDMSDILRVSPAYLSAVENGKRKIPKEWGTILKEKFILSKNEVEELDLIIQSDDNNFFEAFNIDTHDDKAMLIQLARKCQNITPNKYEQIIQILEMEDKDEGKS